MIVLLDTHALLWALEGSPRLSSTARGVIELPVERATVKISGSGDIEVDATHTLDVRISGSGSVTYHGNPEVKKSISGSGELVKK